MRNGQTKSRILETSEVLRRLEAERARMNAFARQYHTDVAARDAYECYAEGISTAVSIIDELAREG